MSTSVELDPPSTNLAPQRGPSVWNAPPASTRAGAGAVALVAGGVILLASSLRKQGNERAGGIALGAACLAAGWMYEGWTAGIGAFVDRVRHPSKAHVDARLDDALDDSFPASDAPSSMQVA
jgi:hypothetical protein